MASEWYERSYEVTGAKREGLRDEAPEFPAV